MTQRHQRDHCAVCVCWRLREAWTSPRQGCHSEAGHVEGHRCGAKDWTGIPRIRGELALSACLLWALEEDPDPESKGPEQRRLCGVHQRLAGREGAQAPDLGENSPKELGGSRSWQNLSLGQGSHVPERGHQQRPREDEIALGRRKPGAEASQLCSGDHWWRHLCELDSWRPGTACGLWG